MIKKIVLLIAFVGLANTIEAQNKKWVTVKDTELGYRIDFPSTAKKDAVDVPTEKGPVVMNTYTVSSPGEVNLVYMTSSSEYPESFFPNGLSSAEAQNTVLDNAVNGAVTNVKGRLMFKEDITFNGYRGRLFKIEVNQGGLYVITMRTVLVGYQLYMMQTISQMKDIDNDRTKQFFDSFELINVKK